MISYKEQIKNHTLNRYIRPTSVASYHEHWETGAAGSHCEILKSLYEDNPEGLTDREAQLMFKMKGVNIDIGGVSARRNDLNKVWLKIRSYSGADVPAYFIVSVNKRKNSSGRTAEVWAINPQIRGI
jgi:hypothetical protein